MMRHLILAGLVLAVTAPVRAQTPQNPPRPDTLTVAERRAELQGRIERNFIARADEELGLTDAQSTRLVEAERRLADRRRTIERETRRLNEVLANELRPGIAANERVVTATLDSLGTLRVGYAQVFKDEQRELSSFLTPVQRAQFYRMRERMMTRASEMRGQRQKREMEPQRPPR